MKKLLIALLVIGAVIACIVYFNSRNRDINLDTVFDEKPPEIAGHTTNAATQTPAQSTDTVKDVVPNTPSTDNGTEKAPNPPTADEAADETNDTADSEKEITEPGYEHTDAEKQKIIGRYIDAEEFYYSMLYQQFDLDSYDVIIRENDDGYNTEYHRVLYYDVNSKSELLDHYRMYFTKEFAAKLDTSSYIEENGKLYCAEVSNTSQSKGTKYTYVVESTDKNNAVVIKKPTNGGADQRMNAVNIGGEWYFSSVAIK